MVVKSKEQAWEEADKLIPNDYEKDEESSARAGYPIYRSTVEYYDYICDLSTRLEVNLKEGNKTVNIWINYTDSEGVAVDVVTESGEMRCFEKYEDFLAEYRFWFSGGMEHHIEERFEETLKCVKAINQQNTVVEFTLGCLMFRFKYNTEKWPR
jgi:hypothetical protein